MAREIRLIEDFKKLIVANAVYADKTNFIKEGTFFYKISLFIQ